MKTRAIDKYIRRATAGLPQFERIDTAAEIRVNLNIRVKELMCEGHTREEAEYLAIKDLGDAFSTNRALLGHAFTHRLGWVLVAVALLGISSWWVWQHRWDYFWGSTQIAAMELNSRDMDYTLRADKEFVERANYNKFRLSLPRGSRSIEILYVTPFLSSWYVMASNSPDKYFPTSPDSIQNPTSIELLLWTGISKTKSRKNGVEYHQINSVIHSPDKPLNVKVNRDSQGKQIPTLVPYQFNSKSFTGIEWATIPHNLGVWNDPNYGSGLSSMVMEEPEELILNHWVLIQNLKIARLGYAKPPKVLPTRNEVSVYLRATDLSQESAKEIKAKLIQEYPSEYSTFRAMTLDGKPLIK